MSFSYFDRNENLQIHGNVNFISGGGSSHDGQNLLHVSQRVQAIDTRTGALALLSGYLVIRWLVCIFKPGCAPLFGPSFVDKPLEQEIEQGFTILCDNTAPSARYGGGHSFTRPQCHPGTRIAVQDHIFQWFYDQDGPIAMWMNGPVGIGKSTIAQNVTSLAAERGALSSAFFFFRSDDTRNSPKHLVATLAYEMTQQIPRTLGPVCRTITSNPLIFSSPLDRQINDILLQPLHVLNDQSSEGPKLIVIDGLDECLDPNAQQAIIRSFISSLALVSSEITPHKLLIVSRPESHIASAFSAADTRAHVKHLSLESWDTEDIFLRSKLDEVKDTHPLKHYLPSIWPDEASFRTLRRRSVGSFAYASAVVRFLASHKHDPERALQNILSLQPHRATAAFTDLDVLYRYILSSLDPDIYLTVQKVLCLHLYSHDHGIARLAIGLSEEQAVLEIALVHVPSVIYVNNGTIQFHHSSFQEFLLDRERSEEHYTFSPIVTDAVATALSNLWLQPVYYDNSSLLDTITSSLNRNSGNVDMDLRIMHTLVATKLPGFIISDDQLEGNEFLAIHRVNEFFLAIQSKSTQSSYSTHGPVYIAAFNVVCAWLRSHFDVYFQGVATVSYILDVIVDIRGHYMIMREEEDLWLYSFSHLARKDRKPIDFFCRLFPEMNCAEVYFGIVEKFLSSSVERLYEPRFVPTYVSPASLPELYALALGRQDAMTENLCRRVEQLIFDRHTTLHATLTQYTSSKLYILRSLYGPRSNIDSRLGLLYFLLDGNHRYYINEPLWKEVAEITDSYIRQVHANLDFPYISQDMEALYRQGTDDLQAIFQVPKYFETH